MYVNGVLNEHEYHHLLVQCADLLYVLTMCCKCAKLLGMLLCACVCVCVYTYMCVCCAMLEINGKIY